jgi:hypothetical protein
MKIKIEEDMGDQSIFDQKFVILEPGKINLQLPAQCAENHVFVLFRLGKGNAMLGLVTKNTQN